MFARMLGCLTAGFIGLVATAASAETVTAPVKRVIVPLGLTSVDTAEVSLVGEFPSTCWQFGTTETTIDRDAKHIIIDARAKYPLDVFCAQVLVRFDQEVQLGALDVGTWTIEILDRPDAKVAPLVIADIDD